MEGLTQYEQLQIAHQTRRPSGVGIAGLVCGIAGCVAAVGAGVWAGSRANNAKEVALAKHDGLRDLVYMQANTLATERAERIAGDVTLTQTVTDTVSGSQQGTLTAQQQAELNAVQSVQQTLFNQAVLGNLSENPQKVMLYSAPQPCGCPYSCAA